MPHNVGVTVIPVVVFALIGLLMLTDAFFTQMSWKGWKPVGHYVVKWTQQYPLWLFLMSGVLGALLGHFFVKGFLGFPPDSHP